MQYKSNHEENFTLSVVMVDRLAFLIIFTKIFVTDCMAVLFYRIKKSKILFRAVKIFNFSNSDTSIISQN